MPSRLADVPAKRVTGQRGRATRELRTGQKTGTREAGLRAWSDCVLYEDAFRPRASADRRPAARLLVGAVFRPGPVQPVRAERQQGEPEQDADAALLEEAVGGHEGQDREAERSEQGQAQVRVERVDVEPVLVVQT